MPNWDSLKTVMKGEVETDALHQSLYATDASIYRELPLGVAFPRTEMDLVHIVRFCRKNQLSIIPRAAGTSLAGQVVGSGLVVDTSRYLNKVLEINREEKWIRVQPGVIRDDLNLLLKPHKLWFSPNTSTSNRCMLGGMLGNNSCGSTSIKYGTTRDKVLEVRSVLSDGSIHTFRPRDTTIPSEYSKGSDIEQGMLDLLQTPEIREKIAKAFPDPSIHRRNTGYALDVLYSMQPFNKKGPPFNLCKLLAGSEGTLAITSEIKFQLDDLPPPHTRILTIGTTLISEALRCAQVAMRFEPFQCELVDDNVLQCAAGHPKYGPYLELLGNLPRGLVIVEVRSHHEHALDQTLSALKKALSQNFSDIQLRDFRGSDIEMIWELRRAGLGLLANMPGDAKAVACIEDTAIALDQLPEYIEEFDRLMASMGQNPIYYAHVGAGELHLRPILNLKTDKGRSALEEISLKVARLVKKYNGSLSGEHGDGRVRAPYIGAVMGAEMVELFEKVKHLWDPDNTFNPGKIVHPKKTTDDLRDSSTKSYPTYETVFPFEEEGGVLRAAEKCNGSGDCRKTHFSPGTMCPSYQATNEERHTTRGRANVFREVLSQGTGSEKDFDSPVLKQALDLCLSCKACANECPSRVDMARMKSTFLHEYYKSHQRPLRDRLFTRDLDLPPALRSAFNLGVMVLNGHLGRPVKSLIGLHPDRKIPPLGAYWKRGLDNHSDETVPNGRPKVLIYADEHTRAYSGPLLKKAKNFLQKLGFHVTISRALNSGRAWISKGMLDKARANFEDQLDDLFAHASEGTYLVGLEPSTLLGLRDELPQLVNVQMRGRAQKIAQRALTLSEFLFDQFSRGNIDPAIFKKEKTTVHLHTHCHYKALAQANALPLFLSALPGVEVHLIAAGCCGMAGAFGYEKEHYALSTQIANLQLLPYLRALDTKETIMTHGLSCQHQIEDLTARKTIHPADWLYHRLKVTT